MSGILYLNINDFILKKNEKGNLLCLNYDVKGLSLVLFYSHECQHCTNLMTKYKQLPLNINGCQFTMININKNENKNLIQVSNNTIAPITYVPDIILYYDGVPYMRYDGAHDIQKIKKFIFDIYQRLSKTQFLDNSTQQQQQQQPQQQQQQPSQKTKQPPQQQQQKSQNTIPAYTIGRPKCSGGDRDDICYLEFNKAYNTSQPQLPQQPPMLHV